MENFNIVTIGDSVYTRETMPDSEKVMVEHKVTRVTERTFTVEDGTRYLRPTRTATGTCVYGQGGYYASKNTLFCIPDEGKRILTLDDVARERTAAREEATAKRQQAIAERIANGVKDAVMETLRGSEGSWSTVRDLRDIREAFTPEQMTEYIETLEWRLCEEIGRRKDAVRSLRSIAREAQMRADEFERMI